MNRIIGTVVLSVSAFAQGSRIVTTLPSYGARQNQFFAGTQPQSAATADFNCDGLMDAVVVRGDSSLNTFAISIVTANGLGGFVNGTAQVVTGPVPAVQWPREIVLADFNGDGRQDVFVPDEGGGGYPYVGYQNTLLLSTPDCHLINGTSGLPQQQDHTRGASAADVDGDGDIDLVVVEDLGATAIPPQLWLNDGAGHFSIAQNALPPTQTNVSQYGYASADFADVNGDGFVDLVFGADERTADSAVLINDGTGRFTQLANAIPAKLSARQPW